MATLILDKLTSSVGAEVIGVNPNQLAADDVLGRAVLDALEDNGVLVFRRLHLQPEGQAAFCRRLGEVDCSADGHHRVSGIYPITLDASNNPSAAYLRATFHWHIDGCTPAGDECPQKATVLSAAKVAEHGGETEFASSYAAYEALGDDEKQRFAAIKVVHSLEASQRRIIGNPTSEQLQKWRSRPVREHPLVWTHSNGRKSLVLGASADYIVGMNVDEGRALLAELLEGATAREKIYRHNWAVGDTVMWDNRGVLHRAAPYPPNSSREMLRTTVLGDEPIR